MSIRHGLEPMVDDGSSTLVLGTLPGNRSLELREYYADTGNCFWDIMGSLFGAGRSVAYDRRVALLLAKGVAVWDVLARAEREGSLDRGIVSGSEVANDFGLFLSQHPGIERIYFNGERPARYYRKLVMPHLVRAAARLPRVALASTSGANTHHTNEAKALEWRVIEPQ